VGWNRCLNPLLESRERQIRCPGCQLWVVTEGHPDPRVAPLPLSLPPRPSTAAPLPPPSGMSNSLARARGDTASTATAVDSGLQDRVEGTGVVEEGVVGTLGAQVRVGVSAASLDPEVAATAEVAASPSASPSPRTQATLVVGMAMVTILEKMGEVGSRPTSNATTNVLLAYTCD
jgi:hypothetical protein